MNYVRFTLPTSVCRLPAYCKTLVMYHLRPSPLSGTGYWAWLAASSLWKHHSVFRGFWTTFGCSVSMHTTLGTCHR